MPSATPAGPGAGLPVAAAAAVPPAGLAAADQAFDDVFRQLTGSLLTTSAEAGEALAEADLDGAIDGDAVEADPAADVLPFGVVPVPVTFTLPAAGAPAPVEAGGGEHVDGERTGAAATSAAAAVTPPAAPGGAPVEGDLVPAGGALETAAAEDSDVLAALTLPAEGAGTATPAAEAEAHVRGLDRRRGMRETPARARTFDTAAAGSTDTTGTPPTNATTATSAGPVNAGTAGTPSAAAPVEGAAAGTPREMPATAERAYALQRALARQQDTTHRDGAAPGLAAQVAQTGAATGGGTDNGGDGEPSKKQGRTWTSTVAPGTAIPTMAAPGAPAAAPGVVPAASQGEAVVPGPAANTAWRTAFASSALADLAGSAVESTRGAAATGLMGVLPPAVELAALRERGPLVVDTPLAMPELDAATGEAVHTQIVKSLRMQWTGGIGEARVTLRPEYLGEVTATIKVEQGVVTATLQADTPEVRRWMESHTATLRDALVDHGLKLDRLTVGEPDRQAAQGDRHGKPRQQPRDQAPRPRARREASETDVPFEVTTD